MTANRTIMAPASGVSGTAFAADVRKEVEGLWDRSTCTLTSIGGTANAITATMTPALLAGLVAGMRFIFTAASANTGAVTLAINGGSAISVKNHRGDALGSGVIEAGATYEVIYTGTEFRVAGSSVLTKFNGYTVFTASGTWTKPVGLPDDAEVFVEAWGAGGGGGDSGASIRSAGGGGGSYVCRKFRAGDLASSETVTVGAGGAKGTNGTAGATGGSSSFGTHLTAYGGGGGYANSATGGGGGGGASTRAPGNAGASAAGGAEKGVFGHRGGKGAHPSDLSIPAGESIEGGGGGGGTDATQAYDGANSFYGGGGGGARGNGTTGVPGTSIFGGSGGAYGNAGSAPGGGGGAFAAGARGEVRVWVRG